MKKKELIAKWNHKLSEIIESEITLSEWENNFIDNISILLSNGKMLSMRQSIALNNIYERTLK